MLFLLKRPRDEWCGHTTLLMKRRNREAEGCTLSTTIVVTTRRTLKKASCRVVATFSRGRCPSLHLLVTNISLPRATWAPLRAHWPWCRKRTRLAAPCRGVEYERSRCSLHLAHGEAMGWRGRSSNGFGIISRQGRDRSCLMQRRGRRPQCSSNITAPSVVITSQRY